MTKFKLLRAAVAGLALLGLGLMFNTAMADIVHNNDVIIHNSLCVGSDCIDNEAFGFSTIVLKENNLRIRFRDTSSAASFPTTDWVIRINSRANGGLDYFGVFDCGANNSSNSVPCGNVNPFLIEGGAKDNSLWISDSSKAGTSGSRIGFGTSTPAVDLHDVSGNTPTLRLEQNGSAGFIPQVWDVAGNETSFFVRDTTNGSTLPFRIRPGAPTSAIDIAASGDVGIGTASPSSAVHVLRSGRAASTDMLKLTSNGGGFITLENTAASGSWFMTHENNAPNRFLISHTVGGGVQLALTQTGDLTITGGLITTGGGGACTGADPCDLVFDPDAYTVPSIEEHAEEMWANKYLPAVGPTKAGEPINVTIKMTRMLNELEKAHIYIEQLNKQNKALETGSKNLQIEIARNAAQIAELEKLIRR